MARFEGHVRNPQPWFSLERNGRVVIQEGDIYSPFHTFLYSQSFVKSPKTFSA
jgi:hypothetical protein